MQKCPHRFQDRDRDQDTLFPIVIVPFPVPPPVQGEKEHSIVRIFTLMCLYRPPMKLHLPNPYPPTYLPTHPLTPYLPTPCPPSPLPPPPNGPKRNAFFLFFFQVSRHRSSFHTIGGLNPGESDLSPCCFISYSSKLIFSLDIF